MVRKPCRCPMQLSLLRGQAVGASDSAPMRWRTSSRLAAVLGVASLRRNVGMRKVAPKTRPRRGSWLGSSAAPRLRLAKLPAKKVLAGKQLAASVLQA